MNKTFYAYLRLIRLHKPIAIFLLLWPTLWALWIAAQGMPHLNILIIFIVGVVVMRSAGDIINDIADRHWDGKVARTKNRPLVTGEVSLRGAIILFIVLLAIAFFLVCLLNRLTIELAFVGVLLAIIYPFLKRVTHWPQVGLGLAYSWGVPMAFAAETGHVSGLGWMLFLATVLWTVAYDTQYAIADREDDIQIGIKSTAVLFAQYDRWIIALIQVLMLAVLVGMGITLALGMSFYLSILVAAMLMGYQYHLIRDRDPICCLKAFLNNHWVGLVIFAGIVTALK